MGESTPPTPEAENDYDDDRAAAYSTPSLLGTMTGRNQALENLRAKLQQEADQRRSHDSE